MTAGTRPEGGAGGLGRRAGAVLLAVVAAACLAACGGDDEVVGLDRVGSADAPKALRLQLNASFSPQSSTPEHAEGFRKLYEAWARRHPEWRIDLTIIPDSQGTFQQARLLEQARVGEAPDCANVDSFAVPLFIEQGALKPVDQEFTREQIRELFPYVREQITGPDGRIYAWWWDTDLRVLYRRADLVPRAPRTWDELIDAALAAKERDPSVEGYLFNGGRWEGTFNDHLGYFFSQGGELLDDEGRPVFAEGRNREAMLEVLRFMARTVQTGAAPRRVSTVGDYDEFQTGAAGGTLAMFLGGSFQWPTLEAALPEDVFATWRVSALPGRTAGQTATSTGGWTVAALSDDPEAVAACMSIVKEIYLGPANELTGRLPTSTRLFDTLETFRTPVYRTFRRLLETGQARPGFAIYPELSNQMQIAMGDVLTGGLSPEEALDRAAERVAQSYERQVGR